MVRPFLPILLDSRLPSAPTSRVSCVTFAGTHRPLLTRAGLKSLLAALKSKNPYSPPPSQRDGYAPPTRVTLLDRRGVCVPAREREFRVHSFERELCASRSTRTIHSVWATFAGHLRSASI